MEILETTKLDPERYAEYVGYWHIGVTDSRESHLCFQGWSRRT